MSASVKVFGSIVAFDSVVLPLEGDAVVIERDLSAVGDATALGDALRKAGERLYERVEVSTVLDADATAANLDRVFTELSRKTHTQDSGYARRVRRFFCTGRRRSVLHGLSVNELVRAQFRQRSQSGCHSER
jgi:hypothetical protein